MKKYSTKGMSKNLYIISTPSQAFFLANTQQVFENSILILLVKTEIEKNSILFYLKKFKWVRVSTIYIPTDNSLFQNLKLLFFRLWLEFFKLNHHIFRNIFLGSYNNFFMLSIVARYESRARIVLLYDGLQMINVSFERKKYGPSLRTFPPLFQQLGFKIPRLEHISYISPFPLQIGDQDSYTLISKNEKKHKPNLLHDKIYFVGQPLVEVGILSQSYYLQNLRWIKSKFSDKEIVYVTHPSEKQINLKEVGKFFKLVSFPRIFEEEYLTSKKFPGTVISFYSSVLVNLCFLPTEIKTIAINIPSIKIIRNDMVSKVEYIMQYLKNIGFSNLEFIDMELGDETTCQEN